MLQYENMRADDGYFTESEPDIEPRENERVGEAGAIFLGLPAVWDAESTEIYPRLRIRDRFGFRAGKRPFKACPNTPLRLSDPRASRIDLVILRESTEGYPCSSRSLPGFPFPPPSRSDSAARVLQAVGLNEAQDVTASRSLVHVRRMDIRPAAFRVCPRPLPRSCRASCFSPAPRDRRPRPGVRVQCGIEPGIQLAGFRPSDP